MSDGSDCDVLILGGGIAGLTCAVGLRERGLRVKVLEKASALGGRARSWTDATTGDPVHIGPHIFLNYYPNLLKLFGLLGTRHKVVWPKSDRFITLVEGSREIALRASKLPAPYHLATDIFRDPELSVADLLSNVPVLEIALGGDERTIADLDDLDARAFLVEMGVSPKVIDRFWTFTTMAIMNVPIEQCSAGALVRFFKYMVTRSDAKIGFADGGLSELYTEQARALIERDGGSVELSTEVRALLAEGDRCTGVELADGRRIEAKTVVATMPAHELAPLVPPTWRRRFPVFSSLADFVPVPYISVFLWFDEKLTTLEFWARTAKPEDFNCDFYDLSNIHTGWEKRPSLITSNIIYSHRAESMSDEDIVAATIDELSEFLPRAKVAKLRHFVVNRIPMAIHAPLPGTERKRPAAKTPIDGLLLAGDWTSTALPSSMESAAASGWIAAEQVLAAHGVHATLREPMPPAEPIPRLMSKISRLVPFGEHRARAGNVLRRSAAQRALGDLASFEVTVDREIARLERFRAPFSLVLFDVSGLRAINRSHGYEEGDRAIAHVASVVSRSLRRTDAWSQLRGGELAALLVDADRTGAALVARKVSERLRDEGLRLAGGGELSVSVRSHVLEGRADITARALLAEARGELRARR